MTTFQNSSDIRVAIQRETVPGTAATDGAGSATQMRIISGSPGMDFARAIIQSQEKRSDATKAMGRLGGHSVTGGYNGEMSVGGAWDIAYEAILRTGWGAAYARTFDNSAGLTSLTVTDASTLTQIGTATLIGSIFIGDIITLTNMSNAANNDIRARVTNVSATVITVAGTPFTIQAADIACTLTRLKKATLQPAGPTSYSHTIEEYNRRIDLSEVYVGCVLVGLKMSFKPGAMATITPTYLGLTRQAKATGASPYFTTPSLTTGVALIADDSTIRKNGADIATFTGFDLDMQITAKGVPVIGSLIPPAIFDDDLMVSGSVTGLRSDFSNLTLQDAETEFEIGILLQEPGAAPKAATGIYIPRTKIAKLSKSALGGDGAQEETLQLMIATHAGSTIIDPSIINFFSSAA